MKETEDPIQIIKEKLLQLPDQVQQAILSSDLKQKMRTIADKHSLMLDQTGLLQNEIFFVMLGMEPSSDFVDNVTSELNIPRSKAEMIAQDINTLIFAPIKTYLREWEEQAKVENAEEKSLKEKNSALERAGGFSVEPSLASTSADGEDSMADSEDVQESDKNDILAGIENPKPSPSMSTPKPEETHTEPLVDHLLGNSNSQTEQKIVHKTEEPPANLPITEETPTSGAASVPIKPSTPPVRPAPAPRKGPDPYRESFN